MLVPKNIEYILEVKYFLYEEFFLINNKGQHILYSISYDMGMRALLINNTFVSQTAIENNTLSHIQLFVPKNIKLILEIKYFLYEGAKTC